ncbi:hypothetical protein [Alexandriicola marinus]|nr:hypothetical protein [Alexandriicola marinus]
MAGPPEILRLHNQVMSAVTLIPIVVTSLRARGALPVWIALG